MTAVNYVKILACVIGHIHQIWKIIALLPVAVLSERERPDLLLMQVEFY